MNEKLTSTLSVSIQELPSRHVACITYYPTADSSKMHAQIGDCFRRVQNWARDHFVEPMSGLTVEIKLLPGGCYAVVSIEKEPQIIGESIGRFYQEYAPQNNLHIDGTRPTYEVYFETTMEYCAPLVDAN
jgi:DNA gyrase inhibitor GyrI